MCWGCQVTSLCKTIGVEKNVNIIKLNENTDLEGKYIFPANNCFSSMCEQAYFLGKPYNEKFVKQFLFKIIKLVSIEKTKFYHASGQIIYNLRVVDSEGKENDAKIIKQTFQRVEFTGEIEGTKLDFFGYPQKKTIDIIEEPEGVYMYLTLQGKPLTKEETNERNLGDTPESIMHQRGYRTYLINVEVCEECYDIGKSPFFK